MLRIFLVRCWPGPAPVCPARAIALVESKCIVICRYGEVPNHFKASSMAATSASKDVCLVPSVLAPWAMAGPVPMSSAVMIHPKPADSRNEPSVQAWHASISGMFGLLPTHWVGRRGRGRSALCFLLL
jgi:hypothetical protein